MGPPKRSIQRITGSRGKVTEKWSKPDPKAAALLRVSGRISRDFRFQGLSVRSIAKVQLALRR